MANGMSYEETRTITTAWFPSLAEVTVSKKPLITSELHLNLTLHNVNDNC